MPIQKNSECGNYCYPGVPEAGCRVHDPGENQTPTIYLMTDEMLEAFNTINPNQVDVPIKTLYGKPFEALPTMEDCRKREAELRAAGERPSIIERPYQPEGAS